MTSSSTLGSTRITLQFGLNRDIDGAARDVQAAINAARADLPTGLPSNPTYRKVNPADAPIMILALTSRHPDAAARCTMPPRRCCSRSCRRSKASARSTLGGSVAAGGARRAQPGRAVQVRHRPGGRARRARLGQRAQPEGRDRGRRAPLPALRQRPGQPRRRLPAADHRLSQRRRRAAEPMSPRSRTRCEDVRNAGLANGKPAVLVILYRAARRQHHRHRRPGARGAAAAATRRIAGDDRPRRSHATAARRSALRCTRSR